MSLDLTKPYRTRDGREAWATPDPNGILVGWIRNEVGIGDEREAQLWFADGRAEYNQTQTADDLVNVSETRVAKVWINRYRAGAAGGEWFSSTFENRADADLASRSTCTATTNIRIACIEREITFTVGEGLDP